MLESSQVGDARRQAARLATESGFNALALGRLAIVVTELATNLVRHAQGGLLLIGLCVDAEVATIELISVDSGPGMRDVERSLADGVSTGGTAGTGLGAARRNASQFLIFSKPGVGSVIVARLSADSSPVGATPPQPGAVVFAGICVAAPGETVSGDAWACRQDGTRAALIVADGLGHGPDAAQAADAAMQVFAAHPTADARGVVERCHAALRSTRGAALASMDIDVAARSVTFCGAGNIAARIISGIGDRSLLSQHGTVGVQIRRIQEVVYELPDHAVLVAHSDGIATRWDLKEVPELLSCDPIFLAAHLIHTKLRGRDDATVVVMQCN
jgi:anti-sigma regulatory factor (Ser/Thr protein kinase)